MKSEALKLWKRGDLHQIIRKEILFGLVPKTLSGMRFQSFSSYWIENALNLSSASPDQMHAIGNLVQLLYHGSFLRKTNGLNSLPTFKKFADILQEPYGLRIRIQNSSISNFIQNSYPIRMRYFLLNIMENTERMMVHHCLMIGDTAIVV